MATEAAKQFETENKAMLERVWKACACIHAASCGTWRKLERCVADDKNNDNQLDTDECRQLVKEMLTEQQKFAPKLIDMMLDSSIQVPRARLAVHRACSPFGLSGFAALAGPAQGHEPCVHSAMPVPYAAPVSGCFVSRACSVG
mgnify:CR=1 FL=1